jgi:hypothetical protein
MAPRLRLPSKVLFYNTETQGLYVRAKEKIHRGQGPKQQNEAYASTNANENQKNHNTTPYWQVRNQW